MDLKITETLNGGDANLTTNDLEVVLGVENMPYLGMFGGSTWWGNDLFSQGTDFQFSAETETVLRTTALNSEGRVKIENAVKRDLQFLLNDIPGSTLDVNVTIQNDDRVSIVITLNSRQFPYVWNPTANRIYVAPPTPPLTDFFSFDINPLAESGFSISFKSFEDETGEVNIEWGDSTSDSYSFNGTSIYTVSHSYSSFGSDRIGNVYYNAQVKSVTFNNNNNLNLVFGTLPTSLEEFAISTCNNYASLPDLTILDYCANSIKSVTLKQCPTVSGLNIFSTPGLYPNLSIVDVSENNLSDSAIDAMLNNIVANKWDGVSVLLIVINGQVDGGTYTAASLTARNAITAAGGSII